LIDRSSMPYRPCAGVTLFNKEGLVFIGRRRPRKGAEGTDLEWQMPQGGIDEGEDPCDAAVRELHEETNVRSAQLLAEAPDWYAYDLPAEYVGRGWTNRFRGQTQKWFAFRFTGLESEIDILEPAQGRHPAEFDSWRWEKLENLPALIVPFKRPVYEKIVAAFRHLAA